MHPDAIIKGLRRELASVPVSDKQRRADIEAEIERVDRLPRPRIAPELGSLAVADKDRELLIGLRRELSRVRADEKDRRKQVQDEIDRVEAAVSAKVHDTPAAKAKTAVKAAPAPETAEPEADGGE
ncbi:MAG: hypothetical protein ACRDNS_29565 [Trebonia sp.]